MTYKKTKLYNICVLEQGTWTEKISCKINITFSALAARNGCIQHLLRIFGFLTLNHLHHIFYYCQIVDLHEFPFETLHYVMTPSVENFYFD